MIADACGNFIRLNIGPGTSTKQSKYTQTLADLFYMAFTKSNRLLTSRTASDIKEEHTIS